jgi:hypothetical protein
MARPMSTASASNGAAYASGRILRTTSTARADGSIFNRASSRRRRLSWFRATAECLNRGTTRPIRSPAQCGTDGCARGEAATRTSRCVVRMRFPSRAMRCNSAPRVIRASRGKLNDAEGVLGSSVLIRDANRELLPSLLATAGQRGTSPLRFHSRTKTVRLEPPRIARAVGRLTHGYSRYGLIRTAVQTGKVNQDHKIGQDR